MENIFETSKFNSMIFQMGYLNQAYTPYPKLLYTIFSVLEILLSCLFLILSYQDNYNLKAYLLDRQALGLGSSFNLQTTLGDENFSFVLNYFNYIQRFNSLLNYIVLITISVFLLIKLSQFFSNYLLKENLISGKLNRYKIIHMFAVMDLFYKSIGELFFLSICINMYTCYIDANDSETPSLSNAPKCFTGQHLSTLIIGSINILLISVYSLYQSMFYNVSNITLKHNYGIVVHFKSDMFNLFGKVWLICATFFRLPSENRILVKYIVYSVMLLISLLYYQSNMYKIPNYFINFFTFKLLFLFLFSIILIPINQLDLKINGEILFIMIVLSCSFGLIGVARIYNRNPEFQKKTRNSNSLTYRDLIILLELILKGQHGKLENSLLNGYLNLLYIEGKYKSNNTVNKIYNAVNKDQKNKGKKNIEKIQKIKKYISSSKANNKMQNISGLGPETNKNFLNISIINNNNKFIDIIEILLNENNESESHGHGHENESFLIKILLCQVLIRKQNNIIKAFTILYSLATSLKLNTIERYKVYCLGQELHEKIKSKDLLLEYGYNHFNHIFEYEKVTINFFKYTELATKNLKKFWIEFITEKKKNSINSSLIINSLSEIYSINKSIQQEFLELYEYNKENAEFLFLFSYYLKNIVKNELLHEEILMKFKSVIKRDLFTPKIDENYINKGLIIVCCNGLEFGKIKWANENASEILLFDNKELTKTKLNKLFPPSLSIKHNYYMDNYLKTGREIFINKTRLAVFINNQNYVTIVVVYPKLLPGFMNGIHFGAIVTKADEKCKFLEIEYLNRINNKKSCITVINDDGLIEGIDKNSNTLLGIPNVIKEGLRIESGVNLKYNLFQLCPKIKEAISNKEFSNSGVLDTTGFEEEFYNDENGIFIEVENKIQKTLNNIKDLNLNFLIEENQEKVVQVYRNNDFENIDTIVSSSENLKNSQRNDARRAIIKSIFKPRNIKFELFSLESSYKDLSLYFIRFIYNCDEKLSNHIEEGNKKKTKLGDILGRMVKKNKTRTKELKLFKVFLKPIIDKMTEKEAEETQLTENALDENNSLIASTNNINIDNSNNKVTNKQEVVQLNVAEKDNGLQRSSTNMVKKTKLEKVVSYRKKLFQYSSCIFFIVLILVFGLVTFIFLAFFSFISDKDTNSTNIEFIKSVINRKDLVCMLIQSSYHISAMNTHANNITDSSVASDSSESADSAIITTFDYVNTTYAQRILVEDLNLLKHENNNINKKGIAEAALQRHNTYYEILCHECYNNINNNSKESSNETSNNNNTNVTINETDNRRNLYMYNEHPNTLSNTNINKNYNKENSFEMRSLEYEDYISISASELDRMFYQMFSSYNYISYLDLNNQVLLENVISSYDYLIEIVYYKRSLNETVDQNVEYLIEGLLNKKISSIDQKTYMELYINSLYFIMDRSGIPTALIKKTLHDLDDHYVIIMIYNIVSACIIAIFTVVLLIVQNSYFSNEIDTLKSLFLINNKSFMQIFMNYELFLKFLNYPIKETKELAYVYYYYKIAQGNPITLSKDLNELENIELINTLGSKNNLLQTQTQLFQQNHFTPNNKDSKVSKESKENNQGQILSSNKLVTANKYLTSNETETNKVTTITNKTVPTPQNIMISPLKKQAIYSQTPNYFQRSPSKLYASPNDMQLTNQNPLVEINILGNSLEKFKSCIEGESPDNYPYYSKLLNKNLESIDINDLQFSKYSKNFWKTITIIIFTGLVLIAYSILSFITYSRTYNIVSDYFEILLLHNRRILYLSYTLIFYFHHKFDDGQISRSFYRYYIDLSIENEEIYSNKLYEKSLDSFQDDLIEIEFTSVCDFLIKHFNGNSYYYNNGKVSEPVYLHNNSTKILTKFCNEDYKYYSIISKSLQDIVEYVQNYFELKAMYWSNEKDNEITEFETEILTVNNYFIRNMRHVFQQIIYYKYKNIINKLQTDIIVFNVFLILMISFVAFISYFNFRNKIRNSLVIYDVLMSILPEDFIVESFNDSALKKRIHKIAENKEEEKLNESISGSFANNKSNNTSIINKKASPQIGDSVNISNNKDVLTIN